MMTIDRGPKGFIAAALLAVLCSIVGGCASGHDSVTSSSDDSATYRTPSPAEMETAASGRSPYIGTRAPKFSLLDQDGKRIHTDDLRGQWAVLYFYPKDDTPGCTCEATEFTNLLGRFESSDAVVLGVSADDPGTHRYFRKKYNINVTLLSDPDSEVMRRYGAWVDVPVEGKKVGRVVRSTFLLSPDGRIAWHWPEVIPEGHAARVFKRLVELRDGGDSAS